MKVGGEAAEALSGAGMLTAKEGGEIAENSLRAGVDDVARGVRGRKMLRLPLRVRKVHS